MRLFSTNGILLVHAPATAVWMILLFLAVLSSAQDQVDDDTAYAKLSMAEDRSRALPGYYIVVFNESRVEDLQSAIDQIQESEQDDVDGEENMMNSTARLNISITVEQQFPRLKMAKISVGLTDGDTGEDDETLMESRKTRLLSWLRSVLVDIIEEVRHMYVICIILLVLLIEFVFWWHCMHAYSDAASHFLWADDLAVGFLISIQSIAFRIPFSRRKKTKVVLRGAWIVLIRKPCL